MANALGQLTLPLAEDFAALLRMDRISLIEAAAFAAWVSATVASHAVDDNYLDLVDTLARNVLDQLEMERTLYS